MSIMELHAEAGHEMMGQFLPFKRAMDSEPGLKVTIPVLADDNLIDKLFD